MHWAGRRTLFSLLERRLVPWQERQTKGFWFVEIWVLVFFILSVLFYVCSFGSKYLSPSGPLVFLVIVSVIFLYRMWEYTPYVVRISIFTLRNKGRAEIEDPRNMDVDNGPHFVVIFRESIMLMVANWSDNFTNLSLGAWLIVTWHELFGLFLTIMVAARVIAFLPRPVSSAERRSSGQTSIGATSAE